MIDYKTAQALILDGLQQLDIEEIKLKDSLGYMLAEDIISPLDHPFFDQSAVDGYAISFEDRMERIKLSGEVAAGGFSNVEVKKGEAFRIFTGAIVPKGIDTVVMQEYVDVAEENGQTYIKSSDAKLKLGGNIRRKGEQLKKGDVTLQKGEKITATGIGFLASIGVSVVKVFRKAKVGVIVSGNEFAAVDEVLQPGKIYESNGVMLQAALSQERIDSDYNIAIDNQSAMVECIQSKLATRDVVIITGGVSVGDYDFTKPALEELGFKTVFHKVNQKPGKPVLFMKREDGKIAFGLPGNPRSAMVCYYMYVYPCLMKMMGLKKPPLTTISLPAGHQIRHKNDGKTHFVTANIVDGAISVNHQQGSHMLMSMATSNVIAILPKEKHEIEAGEFLEVVVLN